MPFKLHDFGARGVSSGESAGLGGMAHLVNFMGTDTMEALLAARRYYGAEMAGFSIPAAEHSTMTSWGRARERQAYEMMLDRFEGEGRLVAVVSDSYDLHHAVNEIWGGALREKVLARKGTLVIGMILPQRGRDPQPDQAIQSVVRPGRPGRKPSLAKTGRTTWHQASPPDRLTRTRPHRRPS